MGYTQLKMSVLQGIEVRIGSRHNLCTSVLQVSIIDPRLEIKLKDTGTWKVGDNSVIRRPFRAHSA